MLWTRAWARGARERREHKARSRARARSARERHRTKEGEEKREKRDRSGGGAVVAVAVVVDVAAPTAPAPRRSHCADAPNTDHRGFFAPRAARRFAVFSYLVFVVMGFEPTALTFECQPETRPTKSRQLLVDSRVYKSICSHLNNCEYSEGSKSKKRIRGCGGRLRTRDLQITTNPCARENFPAAPRSAPLCTKSLLHQQFVSQRKRRRAEDTREKIDRECTRRRRRREANVDTTATNNL